MFDFEFKDPYFLLAALLAPVLFWLFMRSPGYVRFSSLQLLQNAPIGLKTRLSKLPALLIALAWISTSIALAGPRQGNAETRIRREGIAISMVVDCSGSMRALDMRVGEKSLNRLDGVKKVFKDFVLGTDKMEGRADDLVGLISFASFADCVCPLTLDHHNLVEILQNTNIAAWDEQGTAIGEGLALAVTRLVRLEEKKKDLKSKIIILLSDGESDQGVITPMEAASLAKKHDIRVYTIGFGRNERVPFPVMDRRTGKVVLDSRGRPQHELARVPLDEKTLKKIAKETSGQYFHADNVEALNKAYNEINSLERSEITELRYLQYEELFAQCIAAALVLIAAAGVLAGTIFRRLP